MPKKASKSATRSPLKTAKPKALPAVVTVPVVVAPILKEPKKQNGGKRPGAGMPKGHKTLKTITKERAREVLREQVIAHLKPLIDAQLQNAQGISHFMLRDPKTGKFERLTDPEQIQAALNAEGAAEGSTYYIWTKDPSIQAFTDLMNRTLDKPAEQVQEIKLTGSVNLIARLQAARKRLSA